MKNGPTVKSVIPGSIAEEAGIEPGDRILSINGEKVQDIFDYKFLITSDELLLETVKGDGEIWEIEIEKDEYEDLGIEFESFMIDQARSCKNKCIFCFIDQLPKGMRETLYFKDDDSRLSFLTGNYVTLTNMTDRDIDRIIKYRMSPLNVSVHTTNPDLRVFMLKNRFAGNVLDKVKRLVDGGITVNCQIVLCRYVNDGTELDRSLSDLTGMYPGIKSISVVPVGITRYREGLYELAPYDRQASIFVVSQVENWQKKLVKKHGSRIVYLADEFYILAGLDIPGYEEYEDFPQIENGVGLVALLRHEFYEYLAKHETRLRGFILKKTEEKLPKKRSVSIATGVSAYEYIREMTNLLEKKCDYLNVNVYKIKNDFFGENVTVTGLLTGSDIYSQLKGKDLGEELLISESMLKAGEDVLLDDWTVRMLGESLNVKVTPVNNSGSDFINKILGIEEE